MLHYLGEPIFVDRYFLTRRVLPLDLRQLGKRHSFQRQLAHVLSQVALRAHVILAGPSCSALRTFPQSLELFKRFIHLRCEALTVLIHGLCTVEVRLG